MAFLVVFVVIQLVQPKELNWRPTYLPGDKNPFGGIVPRTLLDSFFRNERVVTNNLTLYELADSIAPGDNIISLSDRFDPDPEAVNVLLNKVDSGSHAFISADYFSGKFADTLKLYTVDVYFSRLASLETADRDTSDLKFVLQDIEKKGYYYKLENISYYFSTLDSLKEKAFIISTNAWGKPVTLRIPWGKGYFVLNTTPLAFTNNYFLYESNHLYAAQTLSYLPVARTWWTSYYQVGRLEAETPLRFILNTESLRWAYYLGISALLLFLIFESKRKQRSIPVVRPLANTTLEFVKTIGNMYLHARDHKGIAEKKIAFFLEQVRSKYFLQAESGDAFVETLAKKSGVSIEQAQELFALINVIQRSDQIPEQMLVRLNQQIENFMHVK